MTLVYPSATNNNVSTVNGNNLAHYKSASPGVYSSRESLFTLGLKTFQEKNVNTASSRQEDNHYWLSHKDGYMGVTMFEQAAAGGERCKVKLDVDGKIVEVEDDKLEKANPSALDRTENLLNLKYLNECSLLHVLRQRYGASLIYTYAGPYDLLALNPMTSLSSLYSDKVMSMSRGCALQEEMPAHVYSVGQLLYRALMYHATGTISSHAVCLMGNSGSGKSFTHKHLLHYLCSCLPIHNNVITTERVQAMHTLLEAFTCSRTVINTNATRCANLTSLGFDQSGGITNISVQIFLLERTRLVRRPEGEPTFHVFYQMLAGVDTKMRNSLSLNQVDEPNLFMTALHRPEDKQVIAKSWDRLQHAVLNTLNITALEWQAVCNLLAAIYHLGVAGAVKSSSNGFQFEKLSSARKAAELLGSSLEELACCVFDDKFSNNNAVMDEHEMTASVVMNDGNIGFSAVELLEGFVTGLYTEVVHIVTHFINRLLNQDTSRCVKTLHILDSPGFQSADLCGRQSGGTFEDLCYNYCQERLHLLRHEVNCVMPRLRYAQEHIKLDYESLDNADNAMNSDFPGLVAQVIEGKSFGKANSMMSGSNNNNNDADNSKGLLEILDEEALTSCDETNFIKRIYHLCHQHKQRLKGKGHQRIIRRVGKTGNFIISHCFASQAVQYNPIGWLKNCREYPTTKNALNLLTSITQNEQLSSLVMQSRLSGQSIGGGDRTVLRRDGKATGPFLYRQKSLSIQTKLQMDFLIDLLKRSKTRFINCISPVPNAGLCELESMSSNSSNLTRLIPQLGSLSVPFVKCQLRSFQLLNMLRQVKVGYPDYMTFQEFRNLYGVLAPTDERDAAILDGKEHVAKLVRSLNIEPSNFKLGLSQIFFRHGVIRQLETLKGENVSDSLIRFQAHCRGVLVRRRCEKLKIEHKAVACIQRNAAIYLQMKTWSWWKLFSNVKPLLGVHRTESELKNTADELDAAVKKIEELEKEKLKIKKENEHLELKVIELSSDLRDCRFALSSAGDNLENEQDNKIRLQRDLTDHKIRVRDLEEQCKQLQTSLLSSRQVANSHEHLTAAKRNSKDVTDYVMDTEDDSDDEVHYKERYEKVRRELESLKLQHARTVQSLEAELENETQLNAKKNLDLVQENEDLQRDLAQHKRKVTKHLTDLQDLKLQLDDSEARNTELERRHKRHEADVTRLQANINEASTSLEQAQREKGLLAGEKFRAEKELQGLKAEMSSLQDKLSRVTQQLGEMTSGGITGTSDSEMLALKRVRGELENKIRELEDELDELSAANENLEQAKLLAQMNVVKLTQQHSKEMEERDHELELLRAQSQRHLKQLECQLEEEHADKQAVQRSKRELEAQLNDLINKAPQRDKDVERKLRKDLKKTKALLKDAQLTCEQLRSQSEDKSVLNSLKDKLEELQLQKDSAINAKKSLQIDLDELQQMLDSVHKAKKEVEDRLVISQREKSSLQNQVEDLEEERENLLRKYKSLITQQSLDSVNSNARQAEISSLTDERDLLKRQCAELHAEIDNLRNDRVREGDKLGKFEVQVRELESKLELETTTKNRVMGQVERLKEQIDLLQEEKNALAFSESAEKDKCRRLTRQARDGKDELSQLEQKLSDMEKRRAELLSELESSRDELSTKELELKTAYKKISDLQAIMQAESEGEGDDSDQDDDIRADNILNKADDVLKRRSSTQFLTSPVSSLTRNSVNLYNKTGSLSRSSHKRDSTAGVFEAQSSDDE